MLEKLFRYDNKSPSHITIVCFGIKVHVLRKELRQRREEYKKIYQNNNIGTAPKAQGNLRLIQKANLGLLKIFDNLCKENNLCYWLDFGTLLGAKRHNGFIPWDDDIDVGMPRGDYEEIIELFHSRIEAYPELSFKFSCNYRNKCFVKLGHKDSLNIFIDIFPYDYYYKSADSEEKAEISQKIAKLIKPNFFRCFKDEDKTREYLKRRTEKYILEGNAASNNSSPSLFWGIDFPHKWVNKVYDYENIFPLSNIEFESTNFPAPNMPHEILTSIYGDYMKIPKDVYPRHSGITFSAEEKNVLKNLAEMES